MGEKNLPFDLINVFSPFYLVLDRSDSIIYVSPFLEKCLVQKNLNKLTLTRPFASKINSAILEELTGMVLFFSIEGELVRQMKGQSIIYNEYIVLVGSPLINSASELDKFGMKMTDLPIHDSTGDLLLAIEANRISLTQAKESMAKLEVALEETKKLGESLANQVEIKTIKYKLEKDNAEKALSELNESRVALSRAERDASLTQVATHLAHEINNPLNYILTGKLVLSDSIETLLSNIQEALSTIPGSQEFLDFIKKYIDDIYKSLESIELGSKRIQENILELRGITQIDGDIYKRLNIFSEIHKGFNSVLIKNKWQKEEWKVSINDADFYDLEKSKDPFWEFFGNPFIFSFALRIIFDYSMKKGRKSTTNELFVKIDKISNLSIKYISISVSHNGEYMSDEERKNLFSLQIQRSGFGELINLGMMRELIRKSGGFLSLSSDGRNGMIEISLFLSY